MTVLIATLLIVIAGLTASAVRHVPLGQVHSLYRQGKPMRLLLPGNHVVLPLLDRVAHRIDLSGQMLRFEQARLGSRDVRGTVYWQVLEPERADAVIDQVDQLIRRGAADALRNEVEAAVDDGRDLCGRMKLALNGMLRERGMMVTRVELDLSA
jgi:regulator of protease activity HflC (stomatin/prohibitin superfamily)